MMTKTSSGALVVGSVAGLAIAFALTLGGYSESFSAIASRAGWLVGGAAGVVYAHFTLLGRPTIPAWEGTLGAVISGATPSAIHGLISASLFGHTGLGFAAPATILGAVGLSALVGSCMGVIGSIFYVDGWRIVSPQSRHKRTD